MIPFAADDFETEAGLRRVFEAAVASASFPGMFVPFDLGPDIGPCVDGGTVKNTPIKYAIGGDGTHADGIVVVSASPAVSPPPPTGLGGLALVSQLAENADQRAALSGLTRRGRDERGAARA